MDLAGLETGESQLLALWLSSVGVSPKKHLLGRPRIESEAALCCGSRWLRCHELAVPVTLCHMESGCH